MVSIEKIDKTGVWLHAFGKEYFLDYESFPWFRNKKSHQVKSVVAQNGHLHWPELDVDLSIDSLENPAKYPLKSKS